MKKDPVRGKTLRVTFDDGPMADKTFEHRFDKTGVVIFHMLEGSTKPKADKSGMKNPEVKYEVAAMNANVVAVSYMSAGYTLTTVLDFKTHKLVAFSSNENSLSVQHGSFEEDSAAHSTHASAHAS